MVYLVHSNQQETQIKVYLLVIVEEYLMEKVCRVLVMVLLEML